MILINLKAYKQGIGKDAIEIAEVAEKINQETGIYIAIACQAADIYKVSNSCNIDVYAQHIDPIDFGSHTGWIHPYSVKHAGATGVLINHSEHQLKISDIERTIKIAKEYDLKTIVCANNAIVAKAIACFKPYAIAVEPPELIGGDISVSKAKPEIILETVRQIREIDKNKEIKILCGAGIKNYEDVKKALELGAEGILIASGVVKAEDKEKAISDLAKAFLQ